MKESTEITTTEASAIALWDQATIAAKLCKEIVLRTSLEIGDRKFVRVEGWTAIAVVHGCITTIKSVDETPHGVIAIAELRRQKDGKVLSTAEGFVGHDEPDWYGGTVTRWNKKAGKEMTMTLTKRPDYAIRAMAQTRAISRVCRGPFSHVIVLIGEGLSTTPAEEILGADDEAIEVSTRKTEAPPAAAGKAEEKKTDEVPVELLVPLRSQFEGGKWRELAIHFGTKKDVKLGELEEASLEYWMKYKPARIAGKPFSPEDLRLRAALDVAKLEYKN